MPGGYYVALSGMRTRLDALDRVSSDIANASTAGYKLERAGLVQSDRPSFGAELQSAIDVVGGEVRVDFRAGGIAPTGRDLDVAIDGAGFFEVDTSAGARYTRNGRFVRRPDGVLATAEGDAVQGDSGPITIGRGLTQIDSDGTVRQNGAAVGKLKVVEFNPNAPIVKESAFRFRNDGPDGPQPATESSVKSGALEQSNVSVVERVTELTNVTRNFETLQRAVSVLSEMDTRAISEFSRR